MGWKAENWNIAHRQNVSLRTSANAGVAISIEFRAAHRHTVYSFCIVFQNPATRNCASNQEIATPVCGLVRNDREVGFAMTGNLSNPILPAVYEKRTYRSSYCSCIFSNSRYRARASCQWGRGVKPFFASLLLSRRLLKGRAALLRPYSAVLTGTTLT